MNERIYVFWLELTAAIHQAENGHQLENDRRGKMLFTYLPSVGFLLFRYDKSDCTLLA